jgi:hypothetical protein
MPKASIGDVARQGRVLVSLVEVTEALSVLGLTIDELHGSIDAGEVDRDACNHLNPPTDAGSRAHGTTVRVLREIKIPHGWTICDHQNFSTIISPDAAMEIAVASGDDATGDPDRIPRTKHPKGESFVLGVERNAQLHLFKPPPVTREPRHIAPITWILLRHRQEKIVRCELSIPTSLGDDERVNSDEPNDTKKQVNFEGTRIILPDLMLGPRGGGIKSRDDDPSTTKIDVTVLRRRA